MDQRYICIHGHFYQPPRENPWLNTVERQGSAHPYHDWNERITDECYARNSASRLLDEDQFIVNIINNYSLISFNFGPTLLSWLELHAPDTYAAILKADEMSLKRMGHGNALAQVYNHIIMPLANARDKRTQVLWGVRDFEIRFKRKPEGMWLAETAVDTETLELLAEHGIEFTILAPRQVARVRKIKGGVWQNVTEAGVDTRMPYLCKLPSGKTINIFIYDGEISLSIAFKGLLNSGENLSHRLLSSFRSGDTDPQIVHVATDGESYGHHHKFGDMALSYCLHHIKQHKLSHTINYATYLELFPPQWEMAIHEHSSWSCVHGTERWRSDCGCRIGMDPKWNQKWRTTLREAFDWLRDQLAGIYEEEMKAFVADPWDARDQYVQVLSQRSIEQMDTFVQAHVTREISDGDKVRFFKLLEMQANEMYMYTSCGWFFDDISGIEAVQIMKYAARAIQLAFEITGKALEPEFLDLMEKAKSNIEEEGSGRRIYEKKVQPSVVTLERVAAHYAIVSLFHDYPDHVRLYCYDLKSSQYKRAQQGALKCAVGEAVIQSHLTTETRALQFVVLHEGGLEFTVGVRAKQAGDVKDIEAQTLDILAPDNAHLVKKNIAALFEGGLYSLFHLFQHEQQDIYKKVLQSTSDEVERAFREIYERNAFLLRSSNHISQQLPENLRDVFQFILNHDLHAEFEAEACNEVDLQRLIQDLTSGSFMWDQPRLSLDASQKISRLMQAFREDPQETRLQQIVIVLRIIRPLHLTLNLWKAQNIYFDMAQALLTDDRYRDCLESKTWLDLFYQLGDILGIKIRSREQAPLAPVKDK